MMQIAASQWVMMNPALVNNLPQLVEAMP